MLLLTFIIGHLLPGAEHHCYRAECVRLENQPDHHVVRDPPGDSTHDDRRVLRQCGQTAGLFDLLHNFHVCESGPWASE